MSLQSHIRRTWWSPKCSPSLLGSHSFLCPPFWHLLRLFIFWFEETKTWRSSSHYISKNFFFFFKYCQQFKSLHVVNVYICSLWIGGGLIWKFFFFFFFPKDICSLIPGVKMFFPYLLTGCSWHPGAARLSVRFLIEQSPCLVRSRSSKRQANTRAKNKRVFC